MHVSVNRNIYFLTQALRREPVKHAYAELQRTTGWRAERLNRLQESRIKDLLTHAYRHVPYYRNNYGMYLNVISKLPESEIPDLMKELPVLKKSVILENRDQFMAEGNYVTHTNISSGTTGEPFAYPCDQISWAYRHASIMRGLEMHGVKFGSPYGYFFGQHWKNELVVKTKLKDRFFNRVRFSAFSVTKEAAHSAFNKFKGQKVAYFFGYPSTMVAFCKICATELNLNVQDLQLKVVMATGETLEDYQRAYLEKSLGCRVVNYYGSAEGGAGAFEGPEGMMHENTETTYIEIQENGKINKTDLFLRKFPMIKIATDDVCIPAYSNSTAVLGHRVLGKITGRTGEKIKLPDGREYHAVILDYFFDLFVNHPEVLKFRFVFDKQDVVLLIMNRETTISEKLEQSLQREFKRVFGTINFQVQCVNEIPLLPNGKHRPWVQIN